jgi:hypothetical protein
MTGPSSKESNSVAILHRPFNCMDTFAPCIFLAYFGDMLFSLFSIIWGTFCHGELLKLWPKFEVGLWYCYFHKKITYLGFQAFSSRIEHFEVQKMLQGVSCP